MSHSPGHPSEHSSVAVEPLDLAARVDEALAVQALAFGLTDEEMAIRRPIVLRHLAHPQARALGATRDDGRLVGFVYGMPNERGQWWSTVVEPYLRHHGQQHWLEDSFVITELHVLPSFQGRGLGRRLITRLTDAATQPKSLLSALYLESPARVLYRRLGYRELTGQVYFPSATSPYVVMGAPLPLRRR
ncbi:GNAT family N-acetyltransferase [Streptomyces sp. NPDC005438]|uniref:GNAT family N-acetyltransferase n=1 Tax=Streptomyces sp. NPDC005438 TaxID=3156880 RepID=UPI0033A1157F